jgi:zinc/manganese transport system ATP-binding protein
VRPDVLSKLYGHHVDVVKVHGRVLVVAGPGSGDEELLAESPALRAS